MGIVTGKVLICDTRKHEEKKIFLTFWKTKTNS